MMLKVSSTYILLTGEASKDTDIFTTAIAYHEDYLCSTFTSLVSEKSTIISFLA